MKRSRISTTAGVPASACPTREQLVIVPKRLT
jgi:hypothetical protein